MRPAARFHGPRVDDVGRKLRALRKARQLTQSDLAGRIGIQQSDLCRMETGRYRVSLETLVKILSELDISIAEFFQETLPDDMAADEVALLRAYRRLPDETKQVLLRFVRFIRAEEPVRRQDH